MIRRIARQDVALGMFVHRLEGSWFTHPFWRSKFLLETIEDLEAIRESDVTAIYIDEAKGRPLAPPAEAATETTGSPEPLPAAVPKRPIRSGSYRRNIKPTHVAEELGRAQKIVDSSKAAVKRLFADVRMGNAISLPDVLPVVDEISDSVARNSSALIGMTRLRTADEYTYMHSVAVCALMINLARHLGLDEAMMRDVGMAGLLHDVGKIEVPLDVLNKPGRLTDDEFAVMKSHTERGHDVLRTNGNVPELALDVCLHHHEKIDGTGYPNRLNGEEISLFSKMGSVCDVYDAMSSQRCYKAAWTPAESIAKMYSWRGHFDETLLDAFIRSVGIYPVGTLVRLQSDNLAIVIGHNAQRLTRPHVRIFCSASEPRKVDIRDLDLTRSYDTIVSREDPRNWGFLSFDTDWMRLLTKGVAPTFSPDFAKGPFGQLAA